MNKSEVLKKVQDIVREVIDMETIVLDFDTTTEEVEGWDSLSHVQIVTEIQEFFGIKFSAKEMISWDNVGSLCECICLKTKDR